MNRIEEHHGQRKPVAPPYIGPSEESVTRPKSSISKGPLDDPTQHRESEICETDSYRLRRSTTTEVMGVALVSGFAGDRDLSVTEQELVHHQLSSRGNLFFSDLIYSVSDHIISPNHAKILWYQIQSHKRQLSERLGRNVGVIVATLDYLSNIGTYIKTPTLISEGYISKIANRSMRDGMTGLFNHSTFHELLEMEMKHMRRYGSGISLLLFDIDDFEVVYDAYGHQAGVRILAAFADLLQQEARSSDICCRLGGNEFAVILGRSSEGNIACEIAERIKDKASSIHQNGKVISVSVGVAYSNRLMISPEQFIERADRALYTAESGGGNRVVFEFTIPPPMASSVSGELII